MTEEQAIKGLKENLCSLCAYGSQNMDSCDIRECDNRDYIKALEQPTTKDYVVEDLLKQVCEQERWLSAAGYNAYNVDIAFKSIYTSLTHYTPTQGTCKDCKNFCCPNGIMSTCKKCFRGVTEDFYCADFEKRGIEEV